MSGLSRQQQLTTAPSSALKPVRDTIVVTGAVQTDSADGNASPGDPIGTTGTNYPDIANRRVYIRR